jgi:TusA-related sulfurtransferase
MKPTQVTEVLPKTADAGEYIADFEKSKAPQFKGKSKKKRREMAVAAFMAANKGKKMTKEEITEALVEILSEGQQVHLITTDPESKKKAKEAAQKAGAKDPKFYQQIDAMKPGDTITTEESELTEDDWKDPTDESSMAKSELYSIAKYAIELMKMIEDGEQLDAWVQSKITKAADYVNSVKRYMEGEKALGMSEGGSDGDFEAQEEDKQMSMYYYDKGLEAYSEGDLLKADKYYTAALRHGHYVGWNERDLPPYKSVDEKLDPVGHEDADIDNDGDVDKTDKYLKNKRVKIGAAIAQAKKK